jgi:YaiO family outer membrane protein
VTNNYGNSFGQFVNVQYQTDPWNRWTAGLQQASAFKDQGQSASIGNTHIFNRDWFSDVSASLGSPASFLTRYRVDGALSRRWLEAGNFITTVGGTWDKANDIYSDRTLRLSAAYYFQSPWVVQAGFNLNSSNPGNVIAPSGFGAVTYGFQGRYFITARAGFAREAYQLLNSGNIINSFNSQTLGVNWRQWLGPDWGINLGSEVYSNPFYTRTGGTFSVFKEF